MAKELLDKDRIKYNEHELGKVKVENPNEYQVRFFEEFFLINLLDICKWPGLYYKANQCPASFHLWKIYWRSCLIC
jgi:hypothetical protein